MRPRSYAKLLLLLASAALMTACRQEDRAQIYLQRGQDLYDKGDLTKAQVEFRNLLQIDPKDAQAWFMLAKIRLEQKDLSGANQAFDAALAAHPDDPGLMLAMAGISEQMGDTAGTRSVLERLIARKPKVLDHRTRLAQYLASRAIAQTALPRIQP